MGTRRDGLSVLVVDEEPGVLSFFARILDANGMRALLARNAKEAVAIAERGYVPVDVVLTDVNIRPDAQSYEYMSGPDLVDRIRELRPEARALYMSATLDSEVIRIELKDRTFETTSASPDDQGLIESIRAAAIRPLAHRMHGVSMQ